MTADKSTSNGAVRRTFRDLSNEEVADIEKASFLARGNWYEGFDWDELLKSMRILIISEAGAGKTFECRERQKLLWEAGEPAFFVELTTLATTPLYDSFSPEEQKRFDFWSSSQSEIATFFLDSIDELNLTQVSFEAALKRFSNVVSGKLDRLRLIVTTRPIRDDRDQIEKYLPVPSPVEPSPTAESFADRMMGKIKSKKNEDERLKITRCVGLMPLSNEQIRKFAMIQGVGDIDALIEDLQNRDAFEFAQRPQDLIELCDDWQQHHFIRTHQDQVEQNIRTKLRPRTERREKAQLSVEKAMEGASRLALAATLTRKLTLRYSVNANFTKATEAALDVSKVLHDWNAEEQATLLERPLFGFATYGRVRFHHRSVIEYLAAKRLEAFIADGKSIKSVKRLLFVETAQRNRIVRPSMQPIAVWLGLWRDSIFDEVVALDPSVFLGNENGDPQSLTPVRRTKALEAYVARYGKGGWRGLSTPRIQVHRFSSPEMGPIVRKLWQAGIENDEVRHLLLAIIGAGKLQDCSDIAYEVAMAPNVNVRERGLAVDALLQLKDNRLEGISKSLETEPENWPNSAIRQTTIDLFPTHMPVSRLIKILSRVQEDKRTVGDLNYRLPRKIESEFFAPAYLDELRQAFHSLIVDGIIWKAESHPHLQTLRPDLVISLIAICRRQHAEKVRTLDWIESCTLAIRLSKDTHFEEKATTELRNALIELAPDEREAAFFTEHNFLRGLYAPSSLWNHVYDLSQHGGIVLNRSKDTEWVRKRLSDKNESLEVREMMLWAEMILLNRPELNYGAFLNSLKNIVSDAPTLLQIIDERLKPHPQNDELQRLERQIATQNKQHESQQAKAHASWVSFWKEVSTAGGAVFESGNADNTARNLWQAMKKSGDESRESGWNRRFIERQFGKEVADRLRQTMMPLWRKDVPTLRSERPESEKSTYLVRWQFGLAAISAEAEDRNWVSKISREEAELACRYVPLQLNGFPYWLEDIAVSHSVAVDNILGNELSKSLHENGGANSHSFFLQDLSYASSTVATLFLPRIQNWLIEVTSNNLSAAEQDIENAVKILYGSGRSEDVALLENLARQKLREGLGVPHAKTWLPIMMQINPAEGLKFLEVGLQQNSKANAVNAVEWFATLFGRDRHGVGVDLSSSRFTPDILLRLLRLAYRHVHVNDDVHHEGVFSPDIRDDAEGGRNAVLSALLATTGPEGWAAKLALIDDPLFDHMKDRIAALAEHKAAQEADSDVMTEAEVIKLDEYGESSPSTTEAMFALMLDRLDDIDDLLLQDVSPREAWAGFTDERVLRRELARALDDRKNHSYRVDQEAVTADEKETDIRLRATSSNQQGVIELKLGEKPNWTAAKLRETLKEQLLKKYMAAEGCRAGILVVSIASNRGWKHPDTKANLDFEGLIAMLNEEVARLMSQHGGSIKLLAKGLDLRPRLG